MKTKTTTTISQSQKNQIRVSNDNYISIYDTINSYNLFIKAPVIWKEIQQQDPELKNKSVSKQFCSLLLGGKKVTYTTPCIASKDIQHLIAAIIEWRRLYNLSGRSDYKIDYSKILFNKDAQDALLNKEEVASNISSVASEVSNVVEFKQKPNAVIQVSNKPAQHQQTNPKKSSKKEVVIKGQVFKSSVELQRKLQDILRCTPSNTYLEGENLEFMLELLPRCAYGQALLKKGLCGVIVQQNSGNAYKNFALHVPAKIQTIRIQNYCNPSVNPLFKLNLVDSNE